MRDPYAVLGVPRSATAEDIKNGYRRLAKVLHPDGNKNDPQAGARFAELTAAYEILGDGDKRKAFDRGAIDARGQPARQGLPARLAAQLTAADLMIIATGLMIILLMLAATLIQTFTQSDEIGADNIVKETVLRPAEAVAAAPIESAGVSSAKSADHETANPTTADDSVHAAAPLDQAQIDFLIRRSQKLIADGDIEAARILLRRAAEAHDARAALALGATYDPVMLAKLKVQGIAGNTSLAREWYKTAAGFGSQEAQERLNILGP